MTEGETTPPVSVAVLMGGQSAERDVSLESGRVVALELASSGHAVKPVLIHADGSWEVPRGILDRPIPRSFHDWFTGSGIQLGEALSRLRHDDVKVVFVALHGPMGEDGTVQGLLEMAGIPYTGPEVTAAAVTMDKRLTKQVLRAEGIPTPRYFTVGTDAPRAAGKLDWIRVLDTGRGQFPLPWVLKPNRLGSSVGVVIVGNEEEFLQMAPRSERHLQWSTSREIFEGGGELLVEEFLPGRELTCGVLAMEGGIPRPLPPIEIRPRNHQFFDYQAKYTPGATEELCPAPIGAEMTSRIQELAARVHRVFRADPLSRTDFILDGQGKPQVLEINTIPGMTSTSLIPLAARVAGIPMRDLLEGMVQHARRRARAAPPGQHSGV